MSPHRLRSRPYGGGMTISEYLFLLLTRDDGKAESAFTQAAYGLAAANIVDLAVQGRLSVGDGKDPRVHVIDPSPTGTAHLDAALARIAEKGGKRISSLVQDGKVAATAQIAESLVARHIVRTEPGRLMGLVPAKHPVLDPRPETEIRQRLAAVLRGATPSVEEQTILSVLGGLDLAAKVLETEKGAMTKKELKTRITEIGETSPAGVAVDRAVASAVMAAHAAIMSGAMVAVMAAGSN